jgi:spore maturation protein CgeB
MKLLIIGSDYSKSIERYYFKYIKEINKETILFPAQNRLYDYLNRNITNKIIHKLGISSIYREINSELWKVIKNYNPDVIWIFKGMEILPKTLLKAKQQGIKLVNYNPDNPFIFSGPGSGNTSIKKSIGLYDLHFTYNIEVQKQLINDYKISTEYLPFGYDLNGFNTHESFDEILAACFIGNPDKERASLINQLNKNGIKLHLYGNKWKDFVSSKYNEIFPAIYEENFWETLRKYRIQLNIMRIHNLNSHNMRTFEIPAVGGIQVAPITPEHQLFFEDKKEIYLYQDTFNCVKNINYLLSLSSNDAKIIRYNALKRSEISGYSYYNLAIFALNHIYKKFLK